MSFQQCLFSSAEKCGKIVTILKSDGRDLFDNYRPVTILPSLFEDYWAIGPSTTILISTRVEDATVYEYLGVKTDSLSFKQQSDKVAIQEGSFQVEIAGTY